VNVCRRMESIAAAIVSEALRAGIITEMETGLIPNQSCWQPSHHSEYMRHLHATGS
jgi:hypothetical protein